LIEGGYASFSLRRVAEAAGLSLGNLQHYYPSKELLVAAMLDRVIEGYLQRFARIHREARDPESEFRELIAHVFLDLGSRRTTVFFPELWSMANHDRQVAGHMERMYARYREVLGRAIERLNPALDEATIRRLALFVSASIEGHGMFVGHGRAWRGEIEALLEIATQSFLALIRTTTAAPPVGDAEDPGDTGVLHKLGRLN
jgi:AcrR family transcriptional regulator